MMPRTLLRRAGALLLLFCLLFAGAARAAPFTIYLSNNFVGNDWRQQMLRSAEFAATHGPLAGRVHLIIQNVPTAVEAQIASLTNIIRAKPAAILIDASSGTALNPTITRACRAGIVVVTFDQVASAPCAYRLEANWPLQSRAMAEWMVAMLHGKGSVLMDRGLAGAPISAALVAGYKAVLARHPGIRIVGYFNGNYAIGPEESGVANLLAAHPHVDGIFVQGYGVGAIRALLAAGRPMVPVTGSSFNVSAVTCAETPGATCILASNPAYLSAEALKLAVGVLEGRKPAHHHILYYAPMLTTSPVAIRHAAKLVLEKIVPGKNAFPALPPGLFLPVSPPWLHLTPAEAAGQGPG